MISPTTPQNWVPDGLIGLIIPAAAILADVLETASAQRLITQGAALYLMADGQTSILSIRKPAGAFAKACCVRHLLREAA